MKKRTLIPLIVLFLLAAFGIFNFYALRNTAEYFAHNMNAGDDNVVFLHPEGHQELVLDKEGKVVESPENRASYNFCHPFQDPYCHFWRDTLPWIRWGNSIDDPTTTAERRRAFLKEYWQGVLKTVSW